MAALPRGIAAQEPMARRTVSLMRARNVTETHGLAPDGALVMRIRWE
jgi:hypothetical protein